MNTIKLNGEEVSYIAAHIRNQHGVVEATVVATGLGQLGVAIRRQVSRKGNNTQLDILELLARHPSDKPSKTVGLLHAIGRSRSTKPAKISADGKLENVAIPDRKVDGVQLGEKLEATAKFIDELSRKYWATKVEA